MADEDETAQRLYPEKFHDRTSRKEALYEKAFREGGCTFGDMNYRRHRDTFYINTFLCGNKCPIAEHSGLTENKLFY